MWGDMESIFLVTTFVLATTWVVLSLHLLPGVFGAWRDDRVEVRVAAGAMPIGGALMGVAGLLAALLALPGASILAALLLASGCCDYIAGMTASRRFAGTNGGEPREHPLHCPPPDGDSTGTSAHVAP